MTGLLAKKLLTRRSQAVHPTYGFLASYSSYLLLALSASSLLSAIWYIIVSSPPRQWQNEQDICQILAFTGTVFESGAALWVTCAGVAIWMNLLKARTFISSLSALYTSLRRQLIVFAILCWGLPTLLAIVMEQAHLFGFNGFWCWIDSPVVSRRTEFLYYYLPISGVFVINIALYSVIARKRRKLGIQRIDLLPYIPAAVLVWFFPTMFRVAETVGGEQFPVLDLIATVVLPLQGAVYSCVYFHTLYRRRRHKARRAAGTGSSSSASGHTEDIAHPALAGAGNFDVRSPLSETYSGLASLSSCESDDDDSSDGRGARNPGFNQYGATRTRGKGSRSGADAGLNTGEDRRWFLLTSPDRTRKMKLFGVPIYWTLDGSPDTVSTPPSASSSSSSSSSSSTTALGGTHPTTPV